KLPCPAGVAALACDPGLGVVHEPDVPGVTDLPCLGEALAGEPIGPVELSLKKRQVGETAQVGNEVQRRAPGPPDEGEYPLVAVFGLGEASLQHGHVGERPV